MNAMSAYHRCIFKFHRPFSHAVLMGLLLIATIPFSSAQNEDVPPSPRQTSKSDVFSFNPKLRLNPSMVIIFVCLLSAFFIMGCVSVSIRHCSLHHPVDVFREDRTLGPRQLLHRGLGSSIIDGFPICQYSDVKGLRLVKGVLECAVCLNEFSDEETLRLIPSCSHVFHPECIDAWLASHVTCPVCRANLDQLHGHNTYPATTVPTLDSSSSTVETDNLGIHIHIGSPELVTSLRLETKIMRSHSTGHVPVYANKDCERFTLRLPEDVRSRLIKSELSRARSCVAFTRVRSSTKGFRRTNNGQGNRGSEEFGNSILSSGSPVMEGISGEKSARLGNLMWPTRSFRVSLERLFSETRRIEEFDEERSFGKLMLHHSPV